MAKETIESIISRIGPNKRWETIQDLLTECKAVCEKLGPICVLAGGYFGWKFTELIKMLENEQSDVRCPQTS